MHVGTFPVADMATLEQASAMAAGGEECGDSRTASGRGNARDGLGEPEGDAGMGWRIWDSEFHTMGCPKSSGIWSYMTGNL